MAPIHLRKATRLMAMLTSLAFLLSVSLPAGAAKTSLSMITHNFAPFNNWVRSKIAEYATVQPDVEIVYTHVAGGQIVERILVQQAGGVGPDIMNLMSPTMLDLILDGVIDEPPAEVLNDLNRNFIPPVVEAMKINGRLYGFPAEAIVHLPIANVDLYELTGIALPRTYNDLLVVQRKMSRAESDGVPERIGVQMNVAGQPLMVHWAGVLGAYGAEIFQDGQFTVASPLALRATEDFRELAPVPVRDFLTGRVGTIFRGSYYRQNIIDQKLDLNIRALPTPAGPSGQRATTAYFWITVGNRMSKQKGETWDFIRWLHSTANRRSLVHEVGYPPVTRANLDYYNEEWYRIFAMEFDYGRPLPQLRNWQNIQDVLVEHVAQYLRGNATLLQALENATSAAQAIYNDSK